MAGQVTLGSAALSGLVRPASTPPPDDAHRTLPVPPELRALLPGRGLRRGTTIAVGAGPHAPSGGTSLVYALLAEASRAGSWCAVVGVPAFGALAAADVGIALDRVALVPYPGPEWATVVAALIDGVDVVVLATPGPVSDAITARLAARARQRGSVLVPYGSWAGAADLTLRVTRGRWEGLGSGTGRLRRREVTIVAQGRGAATQPKEITVWMPGFRPLTGTVAIAPLDTITLRPAGNGPAEPPPAPPEVVPADAGAAGERHRRAAGDRRLRSVPYRAAGAAGSRSDDLDSDTAAWFDRGRGPVGGEGEPAVVGDRAGAEGTDDAWAAVADEPTPRPRLTVVGGDAG